MQSLEAENAEMRLLDVEVAYFDKHRAELLATAPWKYVLIKGNKEYGIFDSDYEAYCEGVRLFGQVPMFIHQIVDVDPVHDFPALRNGIMYASTPSL